MKPHSDLRSVQIASLSLLLLSSPVALSQEGTWSLSGSIGVSFLQMRDVNETLDRTVSQWNWSESVPIGPFTHFSLSPSVSSKLSYRYERNLGLSLSVFYFSKTATNSYNGPEASIELERSVGSTDIMVGLTYYLPPLAHRSEFYALMEAGMMFARADALTYCTKTKKVGASTITELYYDTNAKFRKSHVIVNVGAGATIGFLGPMFLKGEAIYKFAKVGRMEGDVVRIKETFQEPSVTEFDFSAVLLYLGLGIEL